MAEDLREKIKEFAEIAASVPENLQTTCFEVLLRDYLSSVAAPMRQSKQPFENESTLTAEGKEKTFEAKAKTQADIAQGDIHVKTRKFMEKYSISLSDLNNIFYKEAESVMPLYEDLKTTKMAEAQIRVTLLQSLHRAIEDGEFITEVENVRAECRDRKSLDGANFTANFRNNANLFVDKYDKDTKSLRLSEEGKKELAQLIKDLQ